MSPKLPPEVQALLEQATAEVRRLRGEVARLQAARHEPIAIVGLGCRFPGGDSPEAFWQVLADGRDMIKPLEERWRALGMAAPKDTPAGARWAGLIEDVDAFDAEFFGISPREAMKLDPQQRLLLEAAWGALEQAGMTAEQLNGSATGVYVATMMHDYEHVVLDAGEQRDPFAVTGLGMTFAAGRLSYVLGLQGPCLTLDTACSGSLVALHLACQSLRDRETELALVCGVNLILSPTLMDLMAQTSALAPDGRCKTFDARANGYVRGEGCGAVVLKRLADAQRDQDVILATIRGSAVNQDGRSSSLTAPNAPAQAALLKRAYANAGIDPRHVSYIEAHGTGTSLGDPIEMDGLRQVMGQPRASGAPCFVGSVKTNVGHLEAAAGMAALFKVVLSLQHDVIPAHLNFKSLNPMIGLDGTPLAVASQARPWKSGEIPRVAGISGFSLSGTNAHVVVEEAPRRADPPAEAQAGAHVLPLSARHPEALLHLAHRYIDYLANAPTTANLADIAYTAGVRRTHHEHRLAVVGHSVSEWREGLQAFVQGERHPAVSSGVHPTGARRPRVVFVFPGQGSQWLGMGRELMTTEPVFRDAIAACDKAVRHYGNWSVLDELHASPETSRLAQVDVVQPLLFSLQVSLAALWRAWDIEPDAVTGHSMGEVAAAYVAGILSLEDAVRVICLRSRLVRQQSGRGAMLVVELDPAAATAAFASIDGHLSIAAYNGETSLLVSGDVAAVQQLEERLKGQNVFCRRVKVDYASHCAHMDALLPGIRDGLAGLVPQKGRVAFYSTVNGQVLKTGLDAPYWADNLRQPVRFAAALQDLWRAGHRVFIEVSPHTVLLNDASTVRRALAKLATDSEPTVVGTLKREQPERATMLANLATLYAQGAALPFKHLQPTPRPAVPLPRYPWQRQRYWVDTSRMTTRESVAVAADKVLYNLAWRQRAVVPAAGHGGGSQTYLVRADGGGLAALLVQALQRSGHPCCLVQAGPAALDVQAGKASLDTVSSAAWVQLIERLRASWGRVDHVVHLGSLDVPAPAVGTDTVLQHQAALCGEVVAMAQALMQPAPAKPRLTLVTLGAHAVGPGREPPRPAQATVWGLGRTFCTEAPECWRGLVDLDPRATPQGNSDALLAQLADSSGEDQVAWRDGSRYALRLEPSSAAAGVPAFRDDAMYLITGGLGGLGGQVAQWMCEHGARHIALLGRNAASPSPSARAMVAALEARGVEVVLLAGDVADRAFLQAALARLQRERPLAGIVHAAGIARKAAMSDLVPADLANEMRPKILGAWLLDELTQNLQLDFLVFFSSMTAVFGWKGQAAYAAANQFMDTLAHNRRARGLAGLSLNWGVWEERGMLPEDMAALFAQLGVGAMPNGVALEALGQSIVNGGAQQLIAKVDWRTMRDIYEMQGPRPLLAEIDTVKAPTPAVDVKDVGLFNDWLAQDAPQKSVRPGPDVWVLCCAANTPLAEALRQQLTARGGQVHWVALGEPAAIEPALGKLSTCRGVIFLGADDAPATLDAAAMASSAALLGRAAGLVRSVVARGWRDMPRLWIITEAAHALPGDAPAMRTSQAPLWGWGRALMYDQSLLRPTRIDVRVNADAAAAENMGEVLVRELLSETRDEEVALRPGGARYVRRLRQRALPAAVAPRRLPSESTYLVCGTGEPQDLAVVAMLSARGARHIVLLGSHDVTAQAREAATLLQEGAAPVRAVAADAADAEALTGALAQMADLPPVRGIVCVNAERAEASEQTLVTGLRRIANLHSSMLGTTLDFFVVGGCAAGFFGAPGTAVCAAIDAFGEAIVAHRRAAGLPGQMITLAPLTEGPLTRGGVARLDFRAAVQALDKCFEIPELHTANMSFDVRQWREAYPFLAGSLRFGDLTHAAAQSPGSDMRSRLQDAPEASRAALLGEFVRDQIAAVLKLPPAKVGPDAPFQSLGIDSLLGIELRNRLETALGLKISATMVWAHPTLAQLTTYLAGELHLTPPQEGSPSPAVAAPRNDVLTELHEQLRRAAKGGARG